MLCYYIYDREKSQYVIFPYFSAFYHVKDLTKFILGNDSFPIQYDYLICFFFCFFL